MLFQRYYANTFISFISVISNSYISLCIVGYYIRINADVGRALMSFYIVLQALRREANLVELTYRLVSEEQILRDQRQKQKRMEGRLHQCWQEYELGTRTASQLLSECGKIYGPSND